VSARRSDQSDLWEHVATFSGLGFVLFGSIGGGYLVGWLLDRWLGTTPVFSLIVAGLGLAGGVIEILQILKRVEKRDRDDNIGSSGN
jgi:F0F1-type ATP synthase assembly protein I